MKKYKLVLVKKETSKDSGFKYLRLEYAPADEVKADGFNADILSALTTITNNTQRNIVDVLSSRTFTADGKPDVAASDKFCNEVGPAFGTLKEKGILCDVEDVEVKVSPYYRINGGVVDTSATYDTITVQVVLNPATGQPFVNNAAQGKANSRLRNGTSMYITVEAYNKQKQAEASVTTMTDAVTAQLATATVGDDNEF